MLHNMKFPMLLAGLALAGCNSGGENEIPAPENSAPLFSSSAGLTASTDTMYSYDIVASDADGDTLAVSVTELPAWLTYDSAAGTLSGTPELANVGEHTITILASDGVAETSQTFTIFVSSPEPVNTAPSFSSSAVLTASVGTQYSYTAAATDVDDDNVTLSASDFPSWLTFDAATGQLSGTPDEADAGSHSVTLAANDGTDETLQEFTITVNAPITDGDWALVWSDEFDGAEIDLSKWEHEVNCDGGGNNEKQCYTADPENSYIEDGVLKIAALPESGASLPYSSARLRTLNKGDWTYGRFEIRAKSVTGQGSWPAIWMLPTDWEYGGWPNSGEIDIFESVNLGVTDGAGNAHKDVYGTLHYGNDWPDNDHTGMPYSLPNGANPVDDFHIYALEWEQGEIRWYVDGVHYQTQRRSEVTTNSEGHPDGLIHQGWYTESDQDGLLWTDAPYDKRFHLILNFAVGGSWPENTNAGGVDASAYNAGNTFDIDYVRVYECSVNPTTGEGCATVDAGYDLPVAEGGTLVNGAAPTPVPPSTGEATPITFFDNSINAAWPAWDCCGGSTPAVVTDDAEHGEVVEFSIGAQPTVVGFNTKEAASPELYDGTGLVSVGALEFDLKLMTAPTNGNATWWVKVEQADQSSEASIQIDAPTIGEWNSYTIPLRALANDGLNLNGIDVVMMFPGWGEGEGAVYRVDNVVIHEVEQAPVAAQYPVFVDGTEGFSGAFYNEGGSMSTTIVSDDAEHGSVLEIVSNSANQVSYLAADAGSVDLSGYAGGTLTFDMKVMQQPTDAAAEWTMKVECGWPCMSAEIVIGPQADFPVGTWQSVTINVDDLTGLNLAAVNNAVVVFPTWGGAEGAIYRLDNVIYNKAAD